MRGKGDPNICCRTSDLWKTGKNVATPPVRREVGLGGTKEEVNWKGRCAWCTKSRRSDSEPRVS
eukprot:8265203-Pyramimonas_sp.AAC.1